VGGNSALTITDNLTTTISGTQTNLSTGKVFVGALSLTASGANDTGNAIYSTGGDGTVVIATSNGGSTTSGGVQMSSWAGGNISLTSVNKSLLSIINSGFSDGNIDNLSGNTVLLRPTYNFLGARSGIVVRGIYYNPTLTSLVNTTHRAIETTTGDVLLGTTSGNTLIGSSVSNTAKLSVKGSGSTSATTSLLVQNSSGVDMLRMQDNGDLTLGTFASGLGKIVVTCDPSYGSKTVMINNFGAPIIRQVSTDVLYFGGQQIASLIAIGYLSFNAPRIYGNTILGNSTGSSFNFFVNVSPYGQTPSTPSRGVLFDGGFGFQSGGYANYFELSPTYTFDISNNRIVKGIYYNPTLVTPNTNDKHYGIQTTSGGAYINTTTPQDSAALQVDSTTQGFLSPRMTNAQRLAIASPAIGLEVYCTDAVEGKYIYKSTGWTFVA